MEFYWRIEDNYVSLTSNKFEHILSGYHCLQLMGGYPKKTEQPFFIRFQNSISIISASGAFFRILAIPFIQDALEE